MILNFLATVLEAIIIKYHLFHCVVTKVYQCRNWHSLCQTQIFKVINDTGVHLQLKQNLLKSCGDRDGDYANTKGPLLLICMFWVLWSFPLLGMLSKTPKSRSGKDHPIWSLMAGDFIQKFTAKHDPMVCNGF